MRVSPGREGEKVQNMECRVTNVTACEDRNQTAKRKDQLPRLFFGGRIQRKDKKVYSRWRGYDD